MPAKSISPNAANVCGNVFCLYAEATASATAKSAAGSRVAMPPTIFTCTSYIPSFNPACDSKTANNNLSRFTSNPLARRSGYPNAVLFTSACISTKSGREPSKTHVKIEPGVVLSGPSNMPDGSATSSSPWSVMRKTPISCVAPKRFFTLRKIRKSRMESPSKYKTVSTKCSSVLGPANAPSLVTWPTIKIAQPVCFAVSSSLTVAARTCVTLPFSPVASVVAIV